MDSYSIALFLHVVGAVGFFVTLGLEWTGLREIRNATRSEQVGTWMGILKGTNKVGFPSMLTTVLTGVYMVLNAWGWVPWILITLVSLVMVIALTVVFTKPRMAAIGRALAMATKGTGSQTFRSPANDPALWISVQTRVALALGIVFLKIAKPDFSGSLLTISAALVLGVVSALPMYRRTRMQAGPAA